MPRPPAFLLVAGCIEAAQRSAPQAHTLSQHDFVRMFGIPVPELVLRAELLCFAAVGHLFRPLVFWLVFFRTIAWCVILGLPT